MVVLKNTVSVAVEPVRVMVKVIEPAPSLIWALVGVIE